MRRLWLLPFCALLLLAQNPNTAKFPGALATDQDLLVGKDQSASTLTAGIGAADTAIPVADGTKFVGYEVLTIDQEQILICSITVNTLNVCTGGRGFAGTTTASHASGATVRGHITAWHHNQVAAEVKAIQGSLNVTTPGQILFASAARYFSGDDNLFWDNTNKYLGLGVSTPAARLHSRGVSALTGRLDATGIVDASAPSVFDVYASAAATPATYVRVGGVLVDFSGGSKSLFGLFSDATPLRFQAGGLNPIYFLTNGVERMRVTATGNILLAISGASVRIGDSTNPTEKLDVNGNIKASGTINAVSGLLVNGSGTSGRFLRGNGTAFVASAGGASGTGACTNQFVRALNDDAAPTCATVGKADTASTFVHTDQANAYSAGYKQTFGPSTTTAGLNTGSTTADPSSPANGDIYYNSSTSRLRCYQNGLWADCASFDAARAYNGSNQTLSTGSWTNLTFNSEAFDYAGLHSTTTNTDRITALQPGLYLLGCTVRFTANATNTRGVATQKNGATYLQIEKRPAVSGETTDMTILTLVQLAANDYVVCQAYQTSGANLDVIGGDGLTFFWAKKLQ